MVLALTHRFQKTTSLNREEDVEALGYFQNAYAVSNQLTALKSTLSCVQALLGMSMIILGTPNKGPASLLTSSAIRIAQSMGLHRKLQEPGLSDTEIEQRKRVFWLAYILDKDISLQTGQPPTQDDDDMDVELPYENDTATGLVSYPNNVDLFNFRVRLALIQGQIYKRLCSVKANKQPINERIVAANELQTMVQTWRASIPIEFQQDYCKRNFQTLSSDLTLPPGLQLAYFNSIATINGFLPMSSRPYEVEGGGTVPTIHIMSVPTSYAAEARKVIKLLRFTPQRHHACIW